MYVTVQLLYWYDTYIKMTCWLQPPKPITQYCIVRILQYVLYQYVQYSNNTFSTTYVEKYQTHPNQSTEGLDVNRQPRTNAIKADQSSPIPSVEYNHTSNTNKQK